MTIAVYRVGANGASTLVTSTYVVRPVDDLPATTTFPPCSCPLCRAPHQGRTSRSAPASSWPDSDRGGIGLGEPGARRRADGPRVEHGPRSIA